MAGPLSFNTKKNMALTKKRTGVSTVKGKTKAARPTSIRSTKAAKKQARRTGRIERTRQRAAAKTARQSARQDGRMDRLSTRLEARKAKTDWRAQRKQAAEQLEDAAVKQNAPEESVAMEVVASPQTVNRMKTYIRAQEEEPISGNPAELATQASMLRQEEIEDTAEVLSDIFEEEGMDPEEADQYAVEYAENFCFDADADTFDPENFVDPVTWAAIQKIGGRGIDLLIQHREKQKKILGKTGDANCFYGDPENFIDPITLAAIGKVGGKGLDLLIQHREKQGKKTLGKTGEQYRAIKAGTAPVTPATSPIGKMAEAGIEEYKAQETKKTINKMLPMIIVGLVVIISLTYYLAKRSK